MKAQIIRSIFVFVFVLVGAGLIVEDIYSRRHSLSDDITAVRIECVGPTGQQLFRPIIYEREKVRVEPSLIEVTMSDGKTITINGLNGNSCIVVDLSAKDFQTIKDAQAAPKPEPPKPEPKPEPKESK